MSLRPNPEMLKRLEQQWLQRLIRGGKLSLQPPSMEDGNYEYNKALERERLRKQLEQMKAERMARRMRMHGNTYTNPKLTHLNP